MKHLLITFTVLFFGIESNAQLLPSFGGSRTGTTGFQFLKIAPDARSVGMGGAVLAIVDDESALYWNPAGITKMDTQNIHLQVGQTLYFADMNMSYAALVHPVSRQTYMGISVVNLSTGDMNVTTEFQPFGTGQTFSANDLSVGVSLARILTDAFRFGITAKYVHEGFADVYSNNGVVDFGFQYDVGKANTRFAVDVSNFGFRTEPSGTITHQTLTGTDTLNNFEQIAVPAVFRIGIAWDPLKKESQQLTLAAQLNHPTDNNETYNLGTEYTWKHILFARTGYEFGADEHGIPNFGFGLRFKRNFGMLQLDYGFENKTNLGTVHRITLSASLF